MLWRLIGKIFTAWAVCAAAIVAVRITGAWQPSPLQPLFAYADGAPCPMPCLFGIRTGMATSETVINALHANPLIMQLQTKDSDRPHEQFISIRELGISAFVRITNDHVYTLSLNSFAKMADLPVAENGIGEVTSAATLGDALLLWGPPTSIEVVRDLVSLKMYISLCYQREHFCIGFIGPRSLRLPLRLPFYSFYATDPDQMDFLLRNLKAKRSVYPWIGATKIENYWRRFRQSSVYQWPAEVSSRP